MKTRLPYSCRDADKFIVRLPDGWRNKITELAKGDHASMNATILRFIEPHMTGKAFVPQLYLNKPYQISNATYINLMGMGEEAPTTYCVRTYKDKSSNTRVELTHLKGALFKELSFGEYSAILAKGEMGVVHYNELVEV